MQWSQAEIEQALLDIRKRAATDADFHALALSDPRAAVAQVSTKPIPENFKIRFVDNARANLTVVLPDPAAKDGSLNEAELELVSGGGGICKTLTPTFNTSLNTFSTGF
jgi:hypothetical protein